MKCPICNTYPHTPIQIQRKGMCRWCERHTEPTINDIKKNSEESQYHD